MHRKAKSFAASVGLSVLIFWIAYAWQGSIFSVVFWLVVDGLKWIMDKRGQDGRR